MLGMSYKQDSALIELERNLEEIYVNILSVWNSSPQTFLHQKW